MKPRTILFGEEMYLAIVEGRKSQTRRLQKKASIGDVFQIKVGDRLMPESIKVKHIWRERLQAINLETAALEGFDGMTEFAAYWDSVNWACKFDNDPWVKVIEFELVKGDASHG